MRVESVMTKEVQACSPNDTLERAAQIMWDSAIGCVPVIDGDRHVVGLVTDRDVAMAAYTQGRALRDIRVTVAMAHEVALCHPKDDLREVEARMQDQRIRRIPVVDAHEQLIGMVSLGDLARATTRQKGNDAGVSADDLARTLAAVSHPRASQRASTP